MLVGMKTAVSGALVSALIASSPCIAASSSLTCRLSGAGSCPEKLEPLDNNEMPSQICIGGGVPDNYIKLKVDTLNRHISMGGIRGVVLGREPVLSEGERYVAWDYEVLPYKRLSLSKVDSKFVLELLGGGRHLEFMCP